MTRDEHLCYCRVCTRRKFETTNGFVCGLTGRVAAFDETCNKFELDVDERVVLNNSYRSEVTESIDRQKSFLKRLTDDKPRLFFLTDNNSISNELPKELIVLESRTKKKHFLWIPILLVGSAVYSIYKNGFSIDGPVQISIFLIFLIGLPGTLLYFYFRNGELFRASGNGLIIKRKTFIPWFKINFIHFEKIQQKSDTTLNLVLRMSSAEDMKIEVTYSNLEPDKLGQILRDFMRKFKRN